VYAIKYPVSELQHNFTMTMNNKDVIAQ